MDFGRAIAALRGIVGPQWVLTSDEDLATYRDFYSPYWGEDQETRASAAVAPANVEQVQQIVHFANEHRLPLYPISTGKNLGYGGSAPNLTGSVVLDLKRMNRILEIDEKRHFVLVEPGVSYFDLYQHIRERGLKLWIDCPDPGWGSFIGNALDHGLGYTVAAMRDHFGAHCGMEVVLPNGELLRTGMGAREGVGSWQGYRYGFGPYVDGLFSQGNLGVVTKMGFWLFPEPEAFLGGTVSVPLYHDIIPLTEILNTLENSGTMNGLPFISSPVTGGVAAAPDPALQALIAKSGGASAAELTTYARGRAFWTCRLQFAGPAKVVEAQWEWAMEQMRSIPGAAFSDIKRFSFPLSDTQIEQLPFPMEQERRATFGIPSLEAFMLGARSPLMPNPSHGHMWLSPVIPRDGEAVIKAQNVFLRAALDAGIYLGSNAPLPLAFVPRTYLMILPFLISEDPEANRKSRDTMSRMIDIGAENGWLEYRAHPAFQDQVMKQYNFGDHALLRFHERIKDALDPNEVLAAGRYGIWPRSMRSGAPT